MVLNVDDNALTNLERTCFEGLMWNHDGDFQFVFFLVVQTLVECVSCRDSSIFGCCGVVLAIEV